MVILSVAGFFIVIFLVATITVAIAWMAFVRQTSETERIRQGEEDAGGDQPAPAAGGEEDSLLFRSDRLSSVNFWENVLAHFDFVEILKLRMSQADLGWSVGRVTLVMLLLGTVAALITGRFLPGWAALIAGSAAAMLPYFYILRVRNRRFRKFAEYFPDVLDSLARALRAGYPLSATVDLVAQEAPEPVKTEMLKVAAETRLGVGWQRALENLAQRMPLLEINLFAAAVTLHSRTGGKLSEVLSGLAGTMRENIALQGEVRALSAHGKFTGAILTAVPVGIAAMMTIVSPAYMQVLYNHPWGKSLIAIGILCLIAAHFVIRKLVDIRI
jgi:tight adherence protein B